MKNVVLTCSARGFVSDIFANNALTDENANVIIGYTSETKTIAEAMKETAGNNKNKITLKQL